MTPAAFNFDQLLRDVPPGAWVAISEDRSRVVAYGPDLADVIAEAATMGEDSPVVTKAPQDQQALALQVGPAA